ncbi:MAG: hypothetical protein IJJ41_05875, partial [Clostridia bacterium]|nr:hypothetical protein [Clostridia bacterium]
ACSLAALIFCKYKVNSEGRLSPVEIFTAVVTKRNQPNHIILDYFYSLTQRRDWQISSHSFNICQRVEKQVFLHAEKRCKQHRFSCA